MINSLAAFTHIWEREAQLTQRILDVLTDKSLRQQISENDRTLGEVAWHIVETISGLISQTGLVLDAFHVSVADSAKAIADQYRQVSQELITAINKQWTDQILVEERDVHGQRWTIGATLNALINHQIHHRGQLTVLMRQAGLSIPGIYGPSRDDWSKMGK